MDTKSDKILYLNIFTRILMSIFTAVAIIAIATIIALKISIS